MLSFLPIVVATIMFNTIYAQMSTLFVEQGDFPISFAPPFPPASISLGCTLAVHVLCVCKTDSGAPNVPYNLSLFNTLFCASANISNHSLAAIGIPMI